jgi:hypothetical protein
VLAGAAGDGHEGREPVLGAQRVERLADIEYRRPDARPGADGRAPRRALVDEQDVRDVVD